MVKCLKVDTKLGDINRSERLPWIFAKLAPAHLSRPKMLLLIAFVVLYSRSAPIDSVWSSTVWPSLTGSGTRGKVWFCPGSNGGLVDCDASGAVTALHLSSQIPALAGTLSPAFGELKSLQKIDLAYNAISSTIPSEFFANSKVKELYLNNNLLHGSIPSQVGSLFSLNVIHVEQNRLSGAVSPVLGLVQSVNECVLWSPSFGEENCFTCPIPPFTKLRCPALYPCSCTPFVGPPTLPTLSPPTLFPVPRPTSFPVTPTRFPTPVPTPPPAPCQFNPSSADGWRQCCILSAAPSIYYSLDYINSHLYIEILVPTVSWFAFGFRSTACNAGQDCLTKSDIIVFDKGFVNPILNRDYYRVSGAAGNPTKFFFESHGVFTTEVIPSGSTAKRIRFARNFSADDAYGVAIELRQQSIVWAYAAGSDNAYPAGYNSETRGHANVFWGVNSGCVAPTFAPPTAFPVARLTQPPSPYPSHLPTPFPTTPNPTRWPTPFPSSPPTPRPPTFAPTPMPTDGICEALGCDLGFGFKNTTKWCSCCFNDCGGFRSACVEFDSFCLPGGTCLEAAFGCAIETAPPTPVPSPLPTRVPTRLPTALPTRFPSPVPSAHPSNRPTPLPSALPTPSPSAFPTRFPTPVPSATPTRLPTPLPTPVRPTLMPSPCPPCMQRSNQECLFTCSDARGCASDRCLDAIACDGKVKGWNGTVCLGYVGDAPPKCTQDGPCAGATDFTYCEGSSSIVELARCKSAGCKRSCSLGASAQNHSSIAAVCYTKGRANCLVGFVCNAQGECVAKPAETSSPTASPSTSPSASPSNRPSSSPSASPSSRPSASPSTSPTRLPTRSPVTSGPTGAPTPRPTDTSAPSASPSTEPSVRPTRTPTAAPSPAPTLSTLIIDQCGEAIDQCTVVGVNQYERDVEIFSGSGGVASVYVPQDAFRVTPSSAGVDLVLEVRNDADEFSKSFPEDATQLSSHVVNVQLQSSAQISQPFAAPVRLCFTRHPTAPVFLPPTACLAWLNPDSSWECESFTLSTNSQRQICGETNHFTLFVLADLATVTTTTVTTAATTSASDALTTSAPGPTTVQVTGTTPRTSASATASSVAPPPVDTRGAQLSEPDSLSGGAIAGIVIGVLLALVVLTAVGGFFFIQRRQRVRRLSEAPSSVREESEDVELSASAVRRRAAQTPAHRGRAPAPQAREVVSARDKKELRALFQNAVVDDEEVEVSEVSGATQLKLAEKLRHMAEKERAAKEATPEKDRATAPSKEKPTEVERKKVTELFQKQFPGLDKSDVAAELSESTQDKIALKLRELSERKEKKAKAKKVAETDSLALPTVPDTALVSPRLPPDSPPPTPGRKKKKPKTPRRSRKTPERGGGDSTPRRKSKRKSEPSTPATEATAESAPHEQQSLTGSRRSERRSHKRDSTEPSPSKSGEDQRHRHESTGSHSMRRSARHSEEHKSGSHKKKKVEDELAGGTAEESSTAVDERRASIGVLLRKQFATEDTLHSTRD